MKTQINWRNDDPREYFKREDTKIVVVRKRGEAIEVATAFVFHQRRQVQMRFPFEGLTTSNTPKVTSLTSWPKDTYWLEVPIQNLPWRFQDPREYYVTKPLPSHLIIHTGESHYPARLGSFDNNDSFKLRVTTKFISEGARLLPVKQPWGDKGWLPLEV